MDWMELVRAEAGGERFECSNEHSDYIKCRKFLE
jgi:hypothetical protein